MTRDDAFRTADRLVSIWPDATTLQMNIAAALIKAHDDAIKAALTYLNAHSHLIMYGNEFAERIQLLMIDRPPAQTPANFRNPHDS